MPNFTFLQTEWPELHESAAKVESLALTDPRACCFYARRTLELAIHWLYEHDDELKRPYDDNLSALIYEPTFRDNLTQDLFLKVMTIKEVGNLAVHSRKPITERDALRATKELFHFLYWLARMYTQHSPAQVPYCYGHWRGQDENRHRAVRVAPKMQLDKTSSVPGRPRCARQASCECF